MENNINAAGLSYLFDDDTQNTIKELEEEFCETSETQEDKEYEQTMKEIENLYSLENTNQDDTNKETYQEPYSNIYQDFREDNDRETTITSTNEQLKQNKIDDVMKDYHIADDTFDDFDEEMRREHEYDDKITLLEQIEMLKNNMEADGVNIKNIPEVDENSDTSKIKNIYRRLLKKSDIHKGKMITNEVLLTGASFLENIFDGEKEYFGARPDLSGWSKTFELKLHRLGFETSSVVQGVVKNKKISPITRILLEIIPSMFLYSAQKNNERKEKKRNIDSEYENAISRIS